MQVQFYDIDWDTSGGDEEDEKLLTAEYLGLPEAIVLEVDDDLDLEDLEEKGADVLSDKYGYCVNACSFEIIKEST
jgi:hypothetical protein